MSKNFTRPTAASTKLPIAHSAHMLKAMCSRPECRNIAENMRQYSWLMRTNGEYSAPRRTMASFEPPPISDVALVRSSSTNTSTFAPTRTFVTDQPAVAATPEAPQRERIWPRVTTLAREPWTFCLLYTSDAADE